MSSLSFAPLDAPAPATASRVAVWQIAALVAVLGWAYLPMLRVFADKWLNDPQYSHGLLVPFFSAYLIRRAWRSESLTLRPMPILGCGLLVATLGLRAASGALLFYQFDAAALLLSLVAASLAIAGPVRLRSGSPPNARLPATSDSNSAAASNW